MIQVLRGSRFPSLSAAALFGMIVLPTLAGAETLTFRNDCNAAVILQGACIIQQGGQTSVQRDRPHLLQKGETCRVQLPGNKLITVYNPKMPNQVLFQTTIPGGNEDLHFALRHDAAQNRIIIERIKPSR